MSSRKALIAFLTVLIANLIVAGCVPTAPAGPCTFTANVPVTAYFLPDASSDEFGTLSAGDSFEALARTADGWVGFDPGVAQAANVGLARHRWVQANVTFAPSCLSGVDLVTLADVEVDVAASG